MRKEEKLLQSIYDSALKFLVPLTPEKTYEIVVQEAIRLSGAQYGSIALWKNGKFQKVYSSNDLLFKEKNRTRANTYRAYKDKEPVVVPFSSMAKAHTNILSLGIKWNVFIPLSYQNKAIGVLTLNFTTDKKPNKEYIRILKVFGSMASLAIRKTQFLAQAEKALEMRNLFIAMAAHELRTPLTSINGYLQLMEKKVDKNSTESRWVQTMYGESLRLTNLINELIEFNKIQSKKQIFHFENCHVISIIKKSIANIKKTFPEHEITFANNLSSSQEIIIGDESKLEQVFTSLLDNAAKFSSTDSLIKVTCSVVNGSIKLTIRDYGRGIEEEDIPKIFEGFYKAGDHQNVGMGVGLFLARSVIKRHNGTINLFSSPEGTTVEVRLPRKKP